MISTGMFLFLSGSPGSVSSKDPTSSTSFSGFLLLVGYMACDAFTSTWQKELFNNYNMSPVQSMCGVNLFSCLLTSIALIQQGAFFETLVFMSQYPSFTFDSIVLSFCSTFGQLFIYHTLKEFGPVVLTIIMSLRQATAMIISCYLYGHVITVIGALGVITVFVAPFLKIYYGYHNEKKEKCSKEKNTRTRKSLKCDLQVQC